MNKIQSFSYGVVCVVGTALFAFLTLASFVFTQYMPLLAQERPINRMDTLPGNLLTVAVFLLLIFGLKRLEGRVPERVARSAECFLVAAAVLWVAGWGGWWINSLDRVPEGDQAFLCAAATYFMEGDYSFLGAGGYCQIYPHQLGLIAFLELFFSVVGRNNYLAFEWLNVFFAAASVFLGYRFLRETELARTARILYCLLIPGCVPLIFYTSWVYGDIPSIFFTMLAVSLAVRYQKRRRWSSLVGMVLSGVCAVLVRKNSLILLIALLILSVLYAMRNRKAQLLLAAIAAVVLSLFCYQGIYRMYEYRSGYELGKGLPVNSWIAMGLEENGGVCGWYNNMPKEVLNSLELDYAATEAVMKETIGERLRYFAAEPKQAVRFFGKKILSQWNDPLYQSLYFSAKSIEENPPETGSLAEKLYSAEGEALIGGLADRMQLLVYLGVLFYFLTAVRRTEQPLSLLPAVMILGGFFFSVIWEAKARYIFPYYVMMYPLAAAGYDRIAAKMTRKAVQKRFQR